MKRLALVAAVLAVAACGPKEAATTDTSNTMTPAPVVDTQVPVVDTQVKIDTSMKDTTVHKM